MLLPPAAIAEAPTSVAGMKRHRRVLILAAPAATDPSFTEQRRALASWRKEGEDRDVTIVEVVGDRASGATDAAAALRQRWALRRDHFTAILIGKDGHEAFRTDKPFAADGLTRTIDAMPMRRAGQR
ncbi:DUF4174 domain-containing protein [uncultured Sphingomonas sp.]|uniref:DUF4174 domain-containing protein n=1 Tax=uncultured Sphingomonas sp. TaxID=158754 RepID=UPI0035CB0A86